MVSRLSARGRQALMGCSALAGLPPKLLAAESQLSAVSLPELIPAAHLGALDANGRTVAVIGTGLMRTYPKENAALQERIANTGMVLSQFLPEAAPTKISFPMRNAVMSGFASATVVIEADWKSGAECRPALRLSTDDKFF